MGGFAYWHWIVLGCLVILLVGYKRLPDAARSVGRSMRIFKTEVKGMTEDDKKRDDKKRDEQDAGSPTVVTPRALEAPPGISGTHAATAAETAPQPQPSPRPRPRPRV